MITNTYSVTSLVRMLLTAIGAFVFVMLFTVQSVAAQSVATDSGLEGGTNDRGFSIGDWVETTDVLKVRNGLGVLLGTQPTFALGRIVSGPQTTGGYAYWEINFDSGLDGWSAAPWLRLSDQRSGGGGGSSSRSGNDDASDRSIQELIALIASLQAQIAAMQGGGGGGSISNDGHYRVFQEDSRLNAGSYDQPVATIEIDDRSEVRYINKVDVEFINEDGDSEVADSFSEISVWVEGSKIYDVDVDDVRWRDDGIDMRTRQKGTIFDSDNFGFGIPVPANREIDVVIAVSVSDDAVSEDWTFLIANNGIEVSSRSNGDFILGDNDTDSVRFSILQGEGADSIVVRSSADDPDATTFQIETNDVSDEFTVFAFDLETDDNEDDIELFQVILDVDLYNVKDGTVAQNVIHDATLFIDGERMDADLQFTNQGQLLLFTDLEYYLDEDDSVTVELEVEFESANETEGVLLDVSVEQILAVTGEGVQITAEGSAQGEEHALRSEGIITELVSIDEELETNMDDESTQGIYTIEFEVTAFESDIYINPTTRHDGGGSKGTEGFTFNLRNSNFIEGAEGASIASISSTADRERSGRYRIDEGETEEFELVVRYTPEESGFYQMQLFSINYNTVDEDPNQFIRLVGGEDFETGFLTLKGSDNESHVVEGSAPTCRVWTNKKSYAYGEKIQVNWIAKNAKVVGFSSAGKDSLRYPLGNQGSNGPVRLEATAAGNIMITITATGDNGQRVNCGVPVYVAEENEYQVFRNGDIDVTSVVRSKSLAAAKCKTLSKGAPAESIRCTWNTKTVYDSETQTFQSKVVRNGSTLEIKNGFTIGESLNRCQRFARAQSDSSLKCYWNGSVIYSQ